MCCTPITRLTSRQRMLALILSKMPTKFLMVIVVTWKAVRINTKINITEMAVPLILGWDSYPTKVLRTCYKINSDNKTMTLIAIMHSWQISSKKTISAWITNKRKSCWKVPRTVIRWCAREGNQTLTRHPQLCTWWSSQSLGLLLETIWTRQSRMFSIDLHKCYLTWWDEESSLRSA